MSPLCFVLMPFGVKANAAGGWIDFDAVYREMIRPAVEAAGMEPVRADEEQVGGWIHKPMFERLMLCDYAVADLTGGNANVYYELGVRHAIRPYSTVIIYRNDTTLPFDLAPLRGMPYDPGALGIAMEQLTKKLREARSHHDDSPVYQFLADLPRPELDHSKTDIFRDRVRYSKEKKRELARAREQGKAGLGALQDIRARLGDLADEETGTIIDLLLSFRAINAFEEMERLYQEMPVPLQRNRLVREQRAFALNRMKRRAEAEEILREIIAGGGASPETNALLGRVYKDLYDEATPGSAIARGHLKNAIETYLKGFEADWRDAYPGVNAVSLMEQTSPPDARQAELLPVVRYAVTRKIAGGRGDYWDHATLLELAVLGRDRAAAQGHLDDALPLALKQAEAFAPETTARNLGLIRKVRTGRGEECGWVEELDRSSLVYLEQVSTQQ